MHYKNALYAALLFAQLSGTGAMAAPYGSGWYQELAISLGYDDNIAKSYRQIDSTNETITTGSFGLGYLNKIGERVEYTIGGYVAYNHHQEFDELSNVAVSINSSLVFQPGTSYDNIWYDLTAELARQNYNDSAPREGYLIALSGSANRRFGINTTGRLGLRYANFNTKDESAFDVTNHEIFLGLDWQLRHDYFLVTEFAFRQGDLISSFSGPSTEYDYEIRTEDPTFESCSGGICDDWFGYRTDGRSQSVDIGLVHVRDLSSFDLSARYYRAKSDAGPSTEYDYEIRTEDPTFESCSGGTCDDWFGYRTDGRSQSVDIGLVHVRDLSSFDLSARYYRAKSDAGPSYNDLVIQLGAIFTF